MTEISEALQKQHSAIFVKVGFNEALKPVFDRLCGLIRHQTDGDAGVYSPPKMKQLRAAFVLPGSLANKRAKRVFLMAEARGLSIVLLRRRQYRKGKPMSQWRFELNPDFSDWKKVAEIIKEWSLDVKTISEAPVVHDWGDGKALPGGLPETNHSKF